MKMKKALLMVLCAVALVVSTVFGTLAYLTDDDAVTNTFTVGKVDIDLDEAEVDENGKAKEDGSRTQDTTDGVEGNGYHLLPGQSYDKDPTVTVKAGSEESYVRMIMTVYNASAVQAIINADDDGDNKIVDYADLFEGWNETKWLYQGYKADTVANTIEFTFWYHTTVDGYDTVNDETVAQDAVLEDLFTQIVVPGYVTNDQLAALYGADKTVGTDDDFKIEVKAHAIQAAGFDDAAAAWAQFTEN